MILIYKKLIELEQTYSRSDDHLATNIKQFDTWLSKLNRYEAESINPLQFASDSQILVKDAVDTISVTYQHTHLLKRFFRFLSSTDEMLEDSYEFSEDEDPRENGMYSYDQDRYLFGSEVSVAVLYKLVDAPIYNKTDEIKKERAPYFTQETAEREDLSEQFRKLIE